MTTEGPGSFYSLELSVAPGGCRRDDLFVSPTLAPLQRVLSRDLSESINVYLMTWYGEVVTLRVHVPGEPTRAIDLLPFITVRLPGYPDIRFPNGECDFDFEADEELYEEDEDEQLSTKLFVGAISPTVELDWEAAAIPALNGPLLPAGATVRVVHGGGVREAIQGHNDFEGGDHKGLRHPGLA